MQNELVRNIGFITILIVTLSQTVTGQTPNLIDQLLTPRLDTANWYNDVQKFNANYSRVANQCQTCVSSRTDTTRTRYCLNTSTAHVRLDTNFHNITPEKLVGQWKVINAGVFQVSDSLPVNADKFIRTEKITDDQRSAQGHVTFTNKVIKTHIKTSDKRQKKRKRYVIVEGRHLMTKKLVGMCGPTMIGITDSGLLIMDLHSYRSIAKKDEYDVFKTYISRTVLEKIK